MQKEIYLRDLQSSDAAALYTMCLDDDLQKSGFSCYASPEDALSAINAWNAVTDNSLFSKAIIETATDKMIGIISLGDMNRYRGYYELEYAISSESRNKGYATQTLHDMLALAFQKYKAEVVAAWVRSHNKASVHVLEKCGFILEGRLRKHARDKSDTLCYSMTLEDWSSAHLISGLDIV